MAQEVANSAMNEDKQIGMRAWMAASPVDPPTPPPPPPIHNELQYK